MSRYRRLKIEGGAFFFTLALADRGSNLLVRHIERLRSAYAEMEKRPGLKPSKNRVPAPKTPLSGTDASGNPLRLEVYNDNTFGFLRLTVSPTSIAAVFVSVDPTSGKTGVRDSFTVDLHANTVSSGGSGGTSGAAAGKGAASSKAQQASSPAAKAASKVVAKRPKAKSKSAAARTKP